MRFDCLTSAKGGKVKRGSIYNEKWDATPCFCAEGYNLRCWNITTGAGLVGDSCVAGYKGLCEYPDGIRIWPYRYMERRDCMQGQAGECTYEQPCHPCEPAKLKVGSMYPAALKTVTCSAIHRICQPPTS